MTKEIVLPPHLYDRIKASAEEHGGIGRGPFFESGCPNCGHGHAWGTEARQRDAVGPYAPMLWEHNSSWAEEPELSLYITGPENDDAVVPAWQDYLMNILRIDSDGYRISFKKWCKRLNVTRGKDEDFITAAPSEQREAVTA